MSTHTPPTFEPRRPGPRRQPTRARVLAAARDHAIRYGWRQARVQDIAKEAGVSRPTLYKDFPSKQELGEALVLDQVEDFLGQLIGVLNNAEPTIHGCVKAAVTFTLEESDRGPFLAAVLTEEQHATEGLLPLITGQGVSVPSLAAQAIAPWFLGRFPEIPRTTVNFLVDVAVRLAISFLASPPHFSREETAEELANLVDAYAHYSIALFAEAQVPTASSRDLPRLS